MSKQRIHRLSVMAVCLCLTGCGNKGDLFLVVDTQRVPVLQTPDVGMVESTDEIADDEVFEPRKPSGARR